jgi:hypothetical protein
VASICKELFISSSAALFNSTDGLANIRVHHNREIKEIANKLFNFILITS